jgi:hypothetical protein
MFQELDPKSVTIIVNAMEEIIVNPEESIIKQKDEGNSLYIVETGTLICTKIFVFATLSLIAK